MVAHGLAERLLRDPLRGHGDWSLTTTTHGTITGSDGSTWRISEVAHFSVDAAGTVRAGFDRMRCEG